MAKKYSGKKPTNKNKTKSSKTTVHKKNLSVKDTSSQGEQGGKAIARDVKKATKKATRQINKTVKKTLGKLERNAKKVEKMKEKAREEIQRLKDTGFSVEPSIIALANSPTPLRVTDKTLEKMKIGLNLSRIRSTRTIDIEVVNNIKNGGASTYTDPINTGIKVTGLKKTINDILKNSKPSDRLANDLAVIVMNLSGRTPAPGLETEYFKIDDKFDPSKLYELSKHIKFKKMDPKTARIILQNPFTNEAAYEKFQEDAKHRGYLSNVQANPDLSNISEATLVELEAIMNSSAAWHIAKRNAHDSEQTKENWTKLYNKLDEEYEDDDLDELVTMIENEESLTSIIKRADEMLTSYMKGN